MTIDVSPLDPAPARRERPTVTATQLGVHLGLTRQRISALADTDHVIERLPDGHFDQDDCRLAYLKWLRNPARRSARSEADAAFQRAKTELLQIKIAEKHKKLMLFSEHEAFVEMLAGLVLTKLGGLAARVGGADLAARRKAEAVVLELRREIAEACQQLGDERGEPDEPA